MTKKSKNGAKKRNTKNIQYSIGKPTTSTRGYVGFAASESDHRQVHSITNPFSDDARGSKLPDADSSKSVAMSIVSQRNIASDANGKAALRVKPSLAGAFQPYTTITGTVITTFAATVAIPDNTTIAAQFSKYRLLSWGIKIYPVLAPTNQSGCRS